MNATSTKKIIATTATSLALASGGAVAVDNQIDPYVTTTSGYVLDIEHDFEQGERVEIAKDKPEMTIKGWNDEYAIKITPQFHTTGKIKKASRTPFTKKMKYESGDMEAFIEPRNEQEFDIDFTLKKAPKSNVFTYAVEGAEQFDFFYQPPLTEQEIAEGAERPENVIGSYAVYHKEQRNHKLGSTNYATGKVLHVYRPKAIDANGAEVWAELLYNEGILSVTVPQNFLDTAVYPVVVDPTFGYTTAGGTTVTSYGTSNPAALVHSDYRLVASNTTITQYSIYTADADSDARIGMTLYDFNGTVPVTIAFTATSFTVAPTAQWYNSATVSQALTNAITYVVAFEVEGDGSKESNVYYDSLAGARRSIHNTSALPTTWSQSNTSGSTYSIYATYTSSGGSGFNSNLPYILFQ